MDLELNYFGRALSVHISDILDPNGESALRRINAIMKTHREIEEDAQIMETIKAKKKIVKTLQNTHFQNVYRIRNYLFAHKLGTAIAQTEEMKGIDVMSLAFIGTEIHDALSDTCKVLLELLKTLN